ncbi:MAG: hypothetical protein ACYC0C_17295 [Devosia sp.]
MIAAIVMASPALAQADLEDREYWTKSLLNFDSLGFRCILSPADDYNTQICENAAKQAAFFAAAADLRFHNSGTAVYGMHLFEMAQAGLVFPLDMELEVMSVGNGTTRATYVRLTLEHFYSDAIEDGALPTSPGYRPKPGDLELWMSSGMATGPLGGHVGAINDMLNIKVREALTLITKYRGTYAN